jgi:hypothetical protein
MKQSKPNNGLTDEQFKKPKKHSLNEVNSLYEDQSSYDDLSPDDFAPCKIYLLKRIFSVGHDEFDGKVVVASNAKIARKLANIKFGDEGPIWTDVNQVFCKEITLDKPLVVLESFRAG